MANFSQVGIQSPSPFYTAATVANAVAYSNNFSLVKAALQGVTVHVDFTIGSLTNATVTLQVSNDGATWRNVTDPGTLTMTATNGYAIPVWCFGCRLFRLAVASSGTVTGSAITINLTYQSAIVAS